MVDFRELTHKLILGGEGQGPKDSSFRGKMLCVASAKDDPYKNICLFAGSERSPNPSRKGWQRSSGDTSCEDASPQRGATPLRGSLYGISLGQSGAEKHEVHGSDAHPSPLSTDEPGHKDTAFKRLVRRGLGSGAPRPKGHVYQQPQQKALVIGINGSGKDQLDHAIDDARRFEKCLRNHLQFNDIHILTDEKEGGASRTRIMGGLRWLFDGARSTDVLVLFISGHCSLTQENRVVSLHSAEKERGPLLIPSTVFKSHLEKLPQGCTVEVVLDCCYSGGLVNADHVIEDMARHCTFYSNKRPSSLGEPEAFGVPGKPRVAQPVPAYADKVGPPYGSCNRIQPVTGPRPDEKIQTSADLTVWAACGSDEKAFESGKPEVENGVLTHAICSAIEKTKDVVLVQRQTIWNNVVMNAQEENQLRFKRGLCEAQHPQVIGSRYSDVMNECAFSSARTKPH